MMHIIIIYPAQISLDVASQLVAIGVAIHRDSRSMDFRSDIQSRTTSYLHETSEEIIDQAHLKYSVYINV